MLLAYDGSGAIIVSSGTNNVYPDGPSDAGVWLAAVLGDRGDVRHMRLNDVRDAELVELVLQGRAKVRNGRIIEVEPAPVTLPPITLPSQPSLDDVLAQIQALQAQQAALQEQSDQLTVLVGGLL